MYIRKKTAHNSRISSINLKGSKGTLRNPKNKKKLWDYQDVESPLYERFMSGS